VFGEGLKRSRMMMIGEMPGDYEDRTGKVFVGPAGRELDKAFEQVGIVRADVYLTNAVKHFRFDERGRPIDTDLAPWVTATVHPAAILRAGDGEAREAERRAFTDDLRTAVGFLSP
jgi:uracil-DNA glycosylase